MGRVMDSIIQTDKKCFLCGRTDSLNDHHIIFGTANRKWSEKYGLKVWLCVTHHLGDRGPHRNHVMDITLKKVAQATFEETHTREEFRAVFGKSYL